MRSFRGRRVLNAGSGSGKELGLAHKSGFTGNRLGELLIEAGFEAAWVLRGEACDLWAVGLREQANAGDVRRLLQRGGPSRAAAL